MSDATPVGPLSLRLSVTDRCELRCSYCMPEDGIPKVERSDILSFEEIVRFVRALRAGFGVAKARITGGEPLVRSGLTDLIRRLAAEDIPDLALTTNGQRLAEMADQLALAGLHRVNVSLDTLRPETFRRLTRGGDLALTLAGIDAAIERGLTPLRLNAVVMRPDNLDEVVDLARYAIGRGCEVRFLELMPIGCAVPLFADCFVPEAEVRERLEQAFDLRPLEYSPGQTSRNFAATDADGRCGVIGFISPKTRPFCRGCMRVRLTSVGRLVTCLASGDGPNVRHLLEDGSAWSAEELCRIVGERLGSKPGSGSFRTARLMGKIGG